MTVTTKRAAVSATSLPNMLTYARIAAIPVVVGCVYAQSIMDGPLWLRWVALAVFIAAAITMVAASLIAAFLIRGKKSELLPQHGQEATVHMG